MASGATAQILSVTESQLFNRSRLTAIVRRIAMFSVACPELIKAISSLSTPFLTQCNQFSICQWLRIRWLN